MTKQQREKENYVLINLFTEYVLEKIGKNKLTQIETVDCKDFWVVKGKTNSKEILDLNKTKEEFKEKFSSHFEDLQLSNTIDLIEYDSEIVEPRELTFEFFNTVNLLPPCTLENTTEKLISTSVFPYGFSNKMGKILYLYAKHLTYNLQSKIIWEKLKINLSYTNIEETFKINLDVCNSPDEKLKSNILDSFDFNYQNFEKKSNESDWYKLITDENHEFDFLKELNENLVVV